MAKTNTGSGLKGKTGSTYIIAEIGSNHDGRMERALALVELAAASGADAVKFQSFTAEGLVAKKLPDKTGKLAPNPLFPIIDKLALPAEWHGPLNEAAKRAGVDFLSAPFDLERLALLDELNVPAIKIASGDLTYLPLLKAAAETGRPILLSTGMAEPEEIERSVAAIKAEGNARIILLHCVTSYPTRPEDANVRAVAELSARFGLPVGLSDHGLGLAAPLGAVALGAVVIERHFTVSRKLPGPDHSYAMEPGEFKTMVEEIRLLEKVLGTGVKAPCGEELKERLVGRRSILAARDLKEGEVVKPEDLKYVRPGGGLSPFQADLLLGKPLKRAVKAEEQLKADDV